VLCFDRRTKEIAVVTVEFPRVMVALADQWLRSGFPVVSSRLLAVLFEKAVFTFLSQLSAD